MKKFNVYFGDGIAPDTYKKQFTYAHHNTNSAVNGLRQEYPRYAMTIVRVSRFESKKYGNGCRKVMCQANGNREGFYMLIQPEENVVQPDMPRVLTPEEKTQQLLCRLFWLVTQGNGIARYASDVRMFVETEIELGVTTKEAGEKIIKDYEKDECR